MLLTRKKIILLLTQLNKKLGKQEISAELYLVGGAVMTLVFSAREATRDLDAYFVPTAKVLEAAKAVADECQMPTDWLNDAVKGFLSAQGEFNSYLELSNLKVFTASAEYLLAMKAIAMRLGPEYQDESDIRFLLRYLNITEYSKALSVIKRFYPLERLPQKSLYALEEILSLNF